MKKHSTFIIRYSNFSGMIPQSVEVSKGESGRNCYFVICQISTILTLSPHIKIFGPEAALIFSI